MLALRDGAFATIPARDLVPGDVVKLRIGNMVPADVQLLQGEYLLVDQSALTGESLPVSKSVNDVAYANTIVKQGEMLALVVNTGARTNFHSVVALFRHEHFLKIVRFALVLTVVAIPVALPAVLSVTMAVGASPRGIRRSGVT